MVSRTCETLPGAEATSSLYIVWIESITTTCGFSCTIMSVMVSRFVSQRKRSVSGAPPTLEALSLIWRSDSSPEI